MDGAVDRAVERLQRRHDEDDAAARNEHLAHRVERRAVVLDVLEDVGAHDGVEVVARDVVLRQTGEVERPDLDVRGVGEGAAEQVDVLGIELGGEHALARGQEARQQAGPGAHLEDAAADEGLHQVPEEAVVAAQDLHPAQRGVAGVLAPDVVHHREAEDRPHRGDRVPPADLLALGVHPAVVRDRHLVDPAAQVRHLGRELGLEAEAIRAQRDAAQDVGAERLVARLHVGEVQVGAHVRQERQEAVADGVPEEQHAPRAAREARAVDHVGVALEDGRDQARVLARVVLEIGVLDDGDVAGHVRDRRPHRGALALVALVPDQHQAEVGRLRQAAGVLLDDLAPSRRWSRRRRRSPPSRSARRGRARGACARFPPRCRAAPGRRAGSVPTSARDCRRRPPRPQGRARREIATADRCLDGRHGGRIRRPGCERRPRDPSSCASPAARFRRWPSLAVAVCGVGCLTADGTLDADGGGTLSVTYPVPPGDHRDLAALPPAGPGRHRRVAHHLPGAHGVGEAPHRRT